MKRILGGLCTFSLIAGMSVTVGAAEPTREEVEKIPAIEGRIDQVSNGALQKAAENMRKCCFRTGQVFCLTCWE